MGNFTRGRRSRNGGAAFASHDALHPASAEEHQLARDLISAPAASFPADPTEFFQRHIHPSGRPWSWHGHEYLRAMIADQAEHRVVQKAAQMGISTWSLGQLLQWCAQGRKVGYYLSDRDFMMAFVQDRVDPLINADPLLSQATLEGKAFDQVDAATDRTRRKSADNLRIKHIGGGSAWFMGLQKRKDVKSIDLDAFILDEVDEVNQDLAAWLDDRILHSAFKRIIELSQPSVPDWGISERYNLSDQKVYSHRCPRCRKWHALEDEWPGCLVARVGRSNIPVSEIKRNRDDLHTLDWRIVCLHCQARLRLGTAPADGVASEWVARHPGRPTSGYRLSQVYGPAMDPQRLAVRWLESESKPARRANFVISILGLPHPGDRQPISQQIFAAACQDWPLSLSAYLARRRGPDGATSPQPLILAGIDQGDQLHAVIAGWDGEYLDVVDLVVLEDDWDRLAVILRDVDAWVVDALPNKSRAKQLLRIPGLNGAMSYLTAQAWSVDYEEKDNQVPLRVVKDDRTTAIDDMADLVVSGTMRFPAPKHEMVQLCGRHLRALVKDHDPRTNRMTYARGVENHFGMAATSVVHALKLALELGLGPRAPLGDPSTWTIRKSLSPHRHKD